MRNLISGVLACAILVSGCGSQKYVKTHEGELPPGQFPALVKPVAFIKIQTLDGKNVYISPSSGLTTEYELEFLPGEHALVVAFDNGVYHSTREQPLQIKLEAGHKYIIRPQISGGRWLPRLLDVTTKPQCWTISVGTTFGPKGCDSSAE